MVPEPPERPDETRFRERIARQAARRRGDRRTPPHEAWIGIGAMGVVGWSVALPTVLGVLAGLWLDHALPQPFSWTLAGMLAGLALGCLNAWHWVSTQREPCDRDREHGEKDHD